MVAIMEDVGPLLLQMNAVDMVDTTSAALKYSTVINVVATIFVAIQNVQNPIKTDKSFRWLYLGRFKS